VKRHISGTTKVTGVFGYPVGHSSSPAMHNAAFDELGLDYVYVPFSVRPDDLRGAVEGVRSMGIVGVNLTIPHKEDVIGLLDWVSDDALRIRSVNTIHNCDGVLKGYSTDGPGFIRALEFHGKSATGSKAVVVGAGGSARATAFALAAGGAEVKVVNRTVRRAVELADLLNPALMGRRIQPIALDDPAAEIAVREADLLVNCTPVGMHPNPDAQPVPSEWLHSGLFVFDQIYNPLQTNLLKAASTAGARTANGIKMLVFQGMISFETWMGKTPAAQVMEEAALRAMASRV
jgi:shikimate dehydrogenase